PANDKQSYWRANVPMRQSPATPHLVAWRIRSCSRSSATIVPGGLMTGRALQRTRTRELTGQEGYDTFAFVTGPATCSRGWSSLDYFRCKTYKLAISFTFRIDSPQKTSGLTKNVSSACLRILTVLSRICSACD